MTYLFPQFPAGSLLVSAEADIRPVITFARNPDQTPAYPAAKVRVHAGTQSYDILRAA